MSGGFARPKGIGPEEATLNVDLRTMSTDRPPYPIHTIVSIVFDVFSSADSILSMNSVFTTCL